MKIKKNSTVSRTSLTTPKHPKVTVICIAYNQEAYIGQAIEGFLMQKTDFPFEIIIHDDASTDDTAKVIQSYADKHPNMIKPVLQTKNQYSKTGAEFLHILYAAARGDYIAICEGDDYWTDPQKLQLQADFLDSHPDYTVCFHRVRMFFQGGEEPDAIYPEDVDDSNFTIKELIKRNYIQTNAVMYRRQKYKNMRGDVTPTDWYMHHYHAQFGRIGFIDRVMSAYRRHAGGLWWDGYKNVDLIWEKHGISFLTLLFILVAFYEKQPEYKAAVYEHISGTLQNIHRADKISKRPLMQEVAIKLSDKSEIMLESLLASVGLKQIEAQANAEQTEQLNESLNQSVREVESLKRELELMRSSRVWKARDKVARLLRKP